LLIVEADSRKVLGQVRVGPMAGSAIEPAGGHVFTGNGDGNSVSEVDPVAMKVVRSVDMTGPVDAIAYHAANGHIYADEDDGTHMFIIDAKTFKLIKTLVIPGHKPEYLSAIRRPTTSIRISPTSRRLPSSIRSVSR
jgi:DNA-binding beta-propeller fold protein YncE